MTAESDAEELGECLASDTKLSAGGREAILQVIAQINQLLTEEVGALAVQEFSGCENAAARKGLLTFELGHLFEVNGGWLFDGSIKTAAVEMKSRAAENAACLERHISAVSEISQLIAGVHLADASDGTYTRQSSR